MIETLAGDRRAVFATRTNPSATTVIIAARIVVRRPRAGGSGSGDAGTLWARTTLTRGVVTGAWFLNCWVSAMTSADGSAPSSLRTRA